MQHPYRRNENGAFCGDQPLFANKKYREKFLTSPRDDPQGDCWEQQATKKTPENRGEKKHNSGLWLSSLTITVRSGINSAPNL